MAWVGTRYSPPAHPPSPHYPGYTPPYPPVYSGADMLVTGVEYGRGAQIGRSTHFRAVILKVQGYDRGI